MQASQNDKTAKMRLGGLDQQLKQLKAEQAELTKQWEKEQEEMKRLQSIKNEVSRPPKLSICVASYWTHSALGASRAMERYGEYHRGGGEAIGHVELQDPSFGHVELVEQSYSGTRHEALLLLCTS